MLQRVEQVNFGKVQDCSGVRLITLRNVKGIRAQIITHDAIMKEFQATDRNGQFTKR